MALIRLLFSEQSRQIEQQVHPYAEVPLASAEFIYA